MIRWQPEYRALRKWMPVLGDAKESAAARKKAVVAVARQLAVDLWWLTLRISTGRGQSCALVSKGGRWNGGTITVYDPEEKFFKTIEVEPDITDGDPYVLPSV